MTQFKRVLVTGGAGYIGALLVPRLLSLGYRVRVLDLYLFGEDVFADYRRNPNLEEVKGDIRDRALLENTISGCDALIHFACISNDPSFELNPTLSRTINYEAFGPLVEMSKKSGVKRFIFASSGSIYGVSGAPEVTEEHPLVPMTDYNRYKALCEAILLERQSRDFIPVVVRPATVCGYSPRQRLDLAVNILVNQAVNIGRITLFGGSQTRPNIHINDMIDLYQLLLELPNEKIAGETFNAGYENHTIEELAYMVKGVVEREIPKGSPVEIAKTTSDDRRSYRISSEKIRRELSFVPKRTIEDAIHDLIAAFRSGKIPDPITNVCYYNVETLKLKQYDLESSCFSPK